MSYRTLPHFRRGTRVNAAAAKQDRLHLEIGEWHFVGDDAELEFGLIGLQEETYSSHAGEVQSEYTLFNRAQGRNRYNRTLKIASPRDARHGSPLFSGHLKVQRTGGDEFSPSHYTLFFDLQLNPTRALAHQLLHPEIRRGQPASSYPVPTLFRRNSVYRVSDEVSLDRKDNVILDRRQQSMSTEEHWRAYRNLYLQEVDNFLSGLLVRAFDQRNLTGSFSRAPRFNLKAAETYWELRSDDPVRLVYGLQPAFRSLGTRSQYRLYDGVVTELTVDGHVPSLNFKIVEGVTAKIYPKTTKRVRFEILHDLKRSSRVVTSHTRRDIWAVMDLLDDLADHDAQEVNVALETLERHAVPSEEQLPPYELVRLVVLSTPDEAMQQFLLSIIVNARGIRCAALDPFRPAVLRLIEAGVLERSRRSSASYRIAEKFTAACDLLSGPDPV